MANYCETELWTLKNIKESLEKEYNGRKKIVIPMFQRGKRWDKQKKETFIDSLKKQYPIGTLLFYRTVDGDTEIYTLIDGLQRGTTIKEYLSIPTNFFTINEFSDETLNKIFELVVSQGGNINRQKETIKQIIVDYVKSLNSYEDFESIDLFTELSNEFPILNSKLKEFGDVLKSDVKKIKSNYNELCNVSIPAVVYSGDENTLPEIFERINSKGVALTEYEIYAASWPRKEFIINNEQIVNYVLKKYDLFNDGEYTISGYNRDQKRIEKNVNSFEYVFGLSKYLQNKYINLKFYLKLKDDETNPVAFQLLNACFNSSHGQIKDVHKIISRFYDNIEILENALISSIEFVNKCIDPIVKFKGNNRKNEGKIFHSQYQIMSLISFVFRKKYDTSSDELTINSNWKESEIKLKNNIWKYYVYDVITKYWGEGGTGKIHTANSENRYFKELTVGQFSSAFDAYTEGMFNKHESKSVTNPSDIDHVILNTIYLHEFTAMEQLSIDKFDIEHIATKEQMKSLIKLCNGEGLPISHIANLCYLPEFENRSKGSNNFYQDSNYLMKSSLTLDIIEDKYSFTKKDDLEFMDLNYIDGDYNVLRHYYVDEFLRNRNEIIKNKFLVALGFVLDTANSNENITDNKITNTFDDQYFRVTKIGLLIKNTFKYLIENDLLTSDDIFNLMDKEYCRKNLGCAYPVLVDSISKIKDNQGHVRYYTNLYEILGRKYYLCSQWYENDRQYVAPWLKGKIKK